MERRLPLLTSGPRDLPARQRTLRGVVDWSYELVSEADRVLFRRLSTLAGGWTLASAAAVCDPDGDAGIDVLEGIASLIDASLVRRTAASGRRRGSTCCRPCGSSDSSASAPRTIGPRSSDGTRIGSSSSPRRQSAISAGRRWNEWLGSLEVEHDNLRAALRWTLDEDQAEIGLCLAASMWRLWHIGGHLSEGRHWTSAILAPPGASERTLARARALTALGGLAYWQNDLPVVRSSYEEALAIALELGDRPMIADGTYNFAFSPGLEGDRESARTMFRQSMEMFERLGDPRGEADSMWELRPHRPAGRRSSTGAELRRRQRSPTPSPRRRVRARGLATRAGPSGLRDGRPRDSTGELPRIAGDPGTARVSHRHRHRAGQSRGAGTEPGPPRSGAPASRCVGGSQGVVGQQASGRVRRSARPSRHASRTR